MAPAGGGGGGGGGGQPLAVDSRQPTSRHNYIITY